MSQGQNYCAAKDINELDNKAFKQKERTIQTKTKSPDLDSAANLPLCSTTHSKCLFPFPELHHVLSGRVFLQIEKAAKGCS